MLGSASPGLVRLELKQKKQKQNQTKSNKKNYAYIRFNFSSTYLDGFSRVHAEKRYQNLVEELYDNGSLQVSLDKQGGV